MKIINDIQKLSQRFRVRFDPFWKEVIAKYPNTIIYETLRTQERQNLLYAQGRTTEGKVVTRTLKSNHITGDAVDIVFKNNGKIERIGPYEDLISIGKKYGIRNLKPKETCHFEYDDKVVYNSLNKEPILANLSESWKLLDGYKDIQNDIHNIANKVREL